VRAGAILGDWRHCRVMRAMPLASVRVEPALEQDVEATPLELLWKAGAATKLTQGLLLGPCTAVALLGITSGGAGLVAPVIMHPQPSAKLFLWVALSLVILVVTVACGVACIRFIPHVFGRPFGLTATNTGVDARTEVGSRVHMDWEEIRLLEVSSGDAKDTLRFAFYSERKRISWTEFASGLVAIYVPVDATCGGDDGTRGSAAQSHRGTH
jgi:hypothetical protein